jgi:EamA domain-containing membrane protein RarD
MEGFPMSLSYREKSLYAALVAEIVVYGPYFFLHRQNSVNKVAGMIIGIIVLQVIVQLVIVALTRNRVTDERDSLIELRGYRAGYLTLASLMVLGLGMLWFHATVGHLELENHMMGLHFLSVFFGMLVISDIVKTVTQIVSYRKAL